MGSSHKSLAEGVLLFMNTPPPITLEEIISQPEVWQLSLNKLNEVGTHPLNNISIYKQAIFCGCGSTYYLSQWAASITESRKDVISRAAPSSELLLNPSSWLHEKDKNLLVAISRSGETSETIQAVKAFQEQGYGDTLVVTCYPDSTLAQIAGNVIAVPDAKEVSVAQTRSFTSMMFSIIWWLMYPSSSGLYSEIGRAGQRLFDAYHPLAKKLGEDLSINHLIYLGDGPLFGLASEAMLKMKEMSLSNSEVFHFLEFRHGPKSVVGKDYLLVGLLDEENKKHELSVLSEMKEYGAKILIIAEKSSPLLEKIADEIVVLDGNLPREWRFPLYLPFLQLLAANRSLAKNLNPDQPEHLDSVVVLEL